MPAGADLPKLARTSHKRVRTEGGTMHEEEQARPDPAGEGESLPPMFAATRPSADEGAGRGPEQLEVEFTGSGSEYFRIWLVNLLLCIVTLGFYLPFARARRLAYFQANTRIGGEPLGFHGNPWKMLRGYVLMLVFGGIYFASSRFSPTAGVAAAAVFVLLWPALWRASLQFRLGNTSWRGLRFGFDGSLGGAYRSMLPAAVPWIGFVSMTWMTDRSNGEAAAAFDPRLGWAMGLSFLAFAVLMPLALAWTKRYQHGHYLYAGQRSRLDAGTGSFYLYALKLFGVSLLLLAAFAAAVFASFKLSHGKDSAMTALFIMTMVFYAAWFVILLPFGQSRLQNLVWTATRSQQLQCRSALRLGQLVGLTVKNLLLVLLTVGLYWPFAKVATARMKLQAMQLEVEGGLENWQAGSMTATQDATGDAAGDFFGIDLGL
jgi:uncharacterized membrane protein YjgN (DUF898 family)